MGFTKILVVENEQPIRQMITDILEIEGYSVVQAVDGAKGIEELRKICSEPCMVFLDLMMPGSNGWDFLDAQRSDADLANVPVVICSAYAESARSVNPSAFVPKPIQLETLLGAVRSFCA